MEDLKKYYEVSANKLFGGGVAKVVKANETLSFEARESETLAIVGESGCGKSTFAKVLMGLETATSGKIMLYDQDIQDTPIEKRTTETVSGVQMVFQNPFDTLNPSMTVGRQIIRALEIFHEGKNDAERRDRMLELLDLVKLPRAFADRMPRQLVGRPEAARRHRPRLCRRRQDRGRRRAGLGAGRVGAGRGDRPADGDPAQEQDDAAVHQPRPVDRALPRATG